MVTLMVRRPVITILVSTTQLVESLYDDKMPPQYDSEHNSKFRALKTDERREEPRGRGAARHRMASARAGILSEVVTRGVGGSWPALGC